MTKRDFFLIIIIGVVVLSGIALWLWPSSQAPVQQAQEPPHAKQVLPSAPPPPITDTGAPISLKTMSKQQALQLYVERARKDEAYDWKQPINFYGKVVDENNQPVAEATARLGWTTFGISGNYAKSETLSDANGLFSLTGQLGKILQIRVEKEGYYTVDGGKGSISFEYADPSNPEWYEPDSNNPVLFHLRKKGPGAMLVDKTVDLILEHNQPQNGVNLITGRIASDGVLQVQVSKPDYQTAKGRYAWSITLSMTEGGLVETKEQFPFRAPENGYTSKIVMDMTDTNSPTWANELADTYYFYLPSSNTYGRLTVDTLGGSRHVQINYSYNSTPGSWYLEPAGK